MNIIKVSIIVPCKNESSHIRQFLDSIIAQDISKDHLEMIISDGQSSDNTIAIISEYTQKFPWIKCITNNKEVTPSGLNQAIKISSGDFIVRLDVHSYYPTDYVSKCIQHIESSGSANVGGYVVIKPQKDTLLGHSIAFALSHKFGAGSAQYRLKPTKSIHVDTVPFGCFKRSIFDKVGLFNEDYIRNQDYELNQRIINAGETILLCSDIYCIYFCRSTFFGFAKHCYKNGYWITYPLQFSFQSLTLRHLIPLFFTCAILTTPMLITVPLLKDVLMVLFLLYFMIALVCAIQSINKLKHPFALITVPIIFLVLHFSFGLGSLFGFFGILSQQLKRA